MALNVAGLYPDTETNHFLSSTMKTLTINPQSSQSPTRDRPTDKKLPDKLPDAKATQVHPTDASDSNNASLFFIGTATTIM